MDCTWQPGIEAGPDTAEVVESLATAVVFSLAGVEGSRAERDTVTQLGDKRSLARHLALRKRLEQPAAIVNVTVDGQSAIEYRELYGRMAWSASLAQTRGHPGPSRARSRRAGLSGRRPRVQAARGRRPSRAGV